MSLEGKSNVLNLIESLMPTAQYEAHELGMENIFGFLIESCS